jgi:hypothetical protein
MSQTGKTTGSLHLSIGPGQRFFRTFENFKILNKIMVKFTKNHRNFHMAQIYQFIHVTYIELLEVVLSF